MEIINKITMKIVMGGDVKPLLIKANPGIMDIKDTKPLDLCQIYGMAHAELKKEKDTAYGPNIYISGEFKAKNLLTGNMFYSTQLYPPGVLHDLIVAKLRTVEPPIQFAFIVGIKYSATSGKEYEYTVRSLIEPKEDNNPFALIENQMKDFQAQEINNVTQ